jgi:L-threonylcarbamoyladenylate synthase
LISIQTTIDEAAALLRAGKLVAFPTETVYGLGANALDPAAVARIFEVKGRPSTSPLIVHVDSVMMARSLAATWPSQAQTLVERYWPGPLTLVLPKDKRVPGIVTAGLDTVGLRWPAHPVAQALIRAAGIPVAAPSANRFTELSPTTAAHVRKSLGDAVDAVLDGGSATVGIESTVLSLAGTQPLLLRPGSIPLPELVALIGPVLTASPPSDGAHLSPGLHPRHYSPRTPLYLLPTGAPEPPGRGTRLEMPESPREYAAVLYETLHRADEQGFDWIALDVPPETPAWAGILDRLQRAAAR